MLLMRCLLLLIAVLSCETTFSQHQVEFARLGVNEGLSQNSVYAIHQDEQGFLWIGTGDGLNRYDGKSFVTYREKFGDTSSRYFPGRIVLGDIFQDGKNRLWLKTNEGLVVFDKKQNRFFKPANFNASIKEWEGSATLIGIDSKQQIWLRNHQEIFRLNPFRWQVEIIKPDIGTSIIKDVVLAQDRLYCLLPDGIYHSPTTSVGFTKWKGVPDAAKMTVLRGNKLALVSGGKIWTRHLQTGKEEQMAIPGSREQSAQLFDLVCEFPKNVFYLRIPGKGLLRYNHTTRQTDFFEHEAINTTSLSNNFITASFVDRTNNLWIGTEGGGLSRLDLKPQKFKSFPAYNLNSRQAANLMVKSIFKQGKKILIGTFSQGLYVVDSTGGNYRQVHYPEIDKIVAPTSINIIYRDGAGRTWMNVGHAVGFLDTGTFQFRSVAFLQSNAKQPPSNFSVYSLLEYAPGKFLAGSNYGLHRLELFAGKIRTFNVPGDSVLAGHIQSLQKAPDGSIYVGKIRDGYCRIKVSESGTQILEEGLHQTGIRAFYFQPHRSLVWMGSENGLIAYHTQKKTYSFYDESNGLSNHYLYSILPETDTTIWVSTNKGLNKAVIHFSPDQTIQKISFHAYTQVDGLQSNEFNTGGFFKSHEGEFFFGGVNGINWFKPDQIVANHFKPNVVLTNLMVNEKEVSGDYAINYLNRIELRYDQNTISFRFASLEFTNAGANEYTYQLQGFDKDWIYSQTGNEARYANLPPGNYVFQVRGSNSDGVWSDQLMTFSIQIHPPFWMTTTFRVVAAVVILAVIGFAIRFYISMLVRNRLKDLEKQQAVNEERLRISKDMHDELGTGLTKIALLSEVSRRAHLQAKAEMPLQEIANTSRQLTQKMGEIIWTLNPGNDTLDNLAAYLKEQLYGLSEAADLPLDFDFPQKIPAITMTNLERQQILLVTKEAFNNVVKHAQATKVCFSLQLKKDDIVFTLRDNGKGFEVADAKPSTNGKRNGLSNMRWRIEQVGGTLHISSVKEKGTTICFSLPHRK